jgi:hypothetical protein
MEEFLGEYIINIGKENLQVAVIRGKLKLDNVQLDGDLIGSHVLGAVGLNGKFRITKLSNYQFRWCESALTVYTYMYMHYYYDDFSFILLHISM